MACRKSIDSKNVGIRLSVTIHHLSHPALTTHFFPHQVLNSDSEDESEIYAAKLLEVMVLQCNGKIDNCLPSFVELVLNRLTRTVKTSELRTMLLQVLIAILYCNPVLLFTILDKLQQAVPNASITQHFIKQWIHDTDCFMG
ncbi:importin-8-like [Cydia pomonella]|uniref:importin-8-like n=1 Tax=Cydia pomonella TaxID=82600 RepID=UPI002ADE13D6|nr:importin-8-like [Cydia pomonella]